jgi:precorrin isomerase
MVKAGINDARLKKFGSKVSTYMNDERTMELAKTESLTRSAAAMRLAIKEGLDGAIILIGNAPTAAFELADQIKQGKLKQPNCSCSSGFCGRRIQRSRRKPQSRVITRPQRRSTIAVAVLTHCFHG